MAEEKPSTDPDIEAGIAAYRLTKAFWPPEFEDSPEHIERLIEKTVYAATVALRAYVEGNAERDRDAERWRAVVDDGILTESVADDIIARRANG